LTPIRVINAAKTIPIIGRRVAQILALALRLGIIAFFITPLSDGF